MDFIRIDEDTVEIVAPEWTCQQVLEGIARLSYETAESPLPSFIILQSRQGLKSHLDNPSNRGVHGRAFARGEITEDAEVMESAKKLCRIMELEKILAPH